MDGDPAIPHFSKDIQELLNDPNIVKVLPIIIVQFMHAISTVKTIIEVTVSKTFYIAHEGVL